MYDILYTKAPVIHTWGGYLLRVASPTTTATVTMLFLLDNKHGQRRADAIITYTLLVTTCLLDLCWLLRAAASTWTYAFFKARPSCWLYHELLCSRRWHPATSIYGVPGPATAMWRLQIVVRHHWAVQPAARVAYGVFWLRRLFPRRFGWNTGTPKALIGFISQNSKNCCSPKYIRH
jgi:hypothetical protein